jgi:hypothetical protein
MRFLNTVTPPTELAVVGEHKDNPETLLLLGEDGNHYAFSIATEQFSQVDPDDTWDVEAISPQQLFDGLD